MGESQVTWLTLFWNNMTQFLTLYRWLNLLTQFWVMEVGQVTWLTFSLSYRKTLSLGYRSTNKVMPIHSIFSLETDGRGSSDMTHFFTSVQKHSLTSWQKHKQGLYISMYIDIYIYIYPTHTIFSLKTDRRGSRDMTHSLPKHMYI